MVSFYDPTLSRLDLSHRTRVSPAAIRFTDMGSGTGNGELGCMNADSLSEHRKFCEWVLVPEECTLMN